MGILRNGIKKITHPFLKRALSYYYRKPRNFSYKGITVKVHPDVFPPHLTLSTKILLNFISEIPLEEKSLLELGCGSGIISLYAKQKGAIVTASDINGTALTYLKNTSEKLNLEVNCVSSNLFDTIKENHFDYIIVNPPYYPKTPKNTKQQAWFCGENFEYFKAFFKQIVPYLKPKNSTYMILSEDCELEQIKQIATDNGIEMQLAFQTKKMGEKNYIFKLVLGEY